MVPHPGFVPDKELTSVWGSPQDGCTRFIHFSPTMNSPAM